MFNNMVFISHFLLYLFFLFANCEDFYRLLGVSRNADNRAIRRAFKKLALTKHPDKNPNDENAHKEFVKLNRAYEVLMNEELRRKYDQYGEEGLSDDFGGGYQYQSWQFYHDNFGIYDEDKEIVTLSRSDFESTVTETDELWFINFYSTFCSHCHRLAPTWRKFAQEMEGVIRIGAVNCAEDPMLCRSQGVMSYPSLIVYPHRRSFKGEREVDLLISFAMDFIDAEVFDLENSDTGLFNSSTSERNSLNWLLDFCTKQTDVCLSELTRKKLAASLNGLLSVGVVNCDKAPKLCTLFQRDNGVVYYRNDNALKPDESLEIDSLDFREVEITVLMHAFSIPYIDGTLQNIVKIEMSENYALLQVYFADCINSKSICDELLLSKFPKWVLFKKHGGYEICHGVMGTINDIVLFAKESHTSPLTTLTFETYADAVNSNEEWLIDYYTPWCPPCLRLLHELRKLHKYVKNIKIGSIDCDQHVNICDRLNVNTYPRIMWHKDGRSYTRSGYSNVGAVVEFIEDARNPAAISLSPFDFEEMVRHRTQSTIWLVDFYAPWCNPCNELAPQYKKLARNMRKKEFLHFGMVDCDYYRPFCTSQNIHAYPTIRLYLPGYQTIDYPSNWRRDHYSMEVWVSQYLPSKVVSIGNEFFDLVLTDKKPWLIDFFVTWCSPCIQFASVFERVAEILEGRVKLAKIDCGQWHSICQDVRIAEYPSLRFYGGSQNTLRQEIGGVIIEVQNADLIVHQIERELTKINRSQKTEL
ncbi:unnamed protein product [Thelazia callipaeda]|uniref:DnaJ homolog subfamily C member 16 n=1 Tax=Thelazia callipaeda TaxID=103827 RepID=A0A0N5CVN5_THECL|nr:unnamed protein product [Thelazia callipaeda]